MTTTHTEARWLRTADARCAGFSFTELAFGVLIFVISAVVLINHLSVNYSSTRDQADRVFAFSRAQGMLSEIQSYVDRGLITAAIDLDALDDGTVNKPTLTITESGGSLVPPDHPLSGNLQRNGQWLWSRRITVQPFAGLSNRNTRYVTVRIYRKDSSGVDRPLADLSSVVNSLGSAFPTAQVFDVYFVAIESIPGWWVYMDAIRPFVESTITDLESRNPGLTVRTHWITKATYGRNQVYRPYINELQDSNQNVPEVYYYPGLMPAGSASTYYYVPGLIKARVSFDGVERHGYQPNLAQPDYNPMPYALADYYNHAMRLPLEQAFHDRRVAAISAGKAANAQVDDESEEPTLRLFLEDLCSNPDKYRNALILNLHGELLPMPPLRNYSDPAKSPEILRDVRVVTHPEELRTDRTVTTGGGDVHLRVYGYTTRPSTYAGPRVIPETMPIALQIMDLDLTDPTNTSGLYPELETGVQVENLFGGVLVGGDDKYRPLAASKHKTLGPGPIADEMHYDVKFVDPGPGLQKYTLLRLYNTPVVAPYVDDGGGVFRGLNNNERSRLYGLEYVPACTEAALDFSRNLYTSGDGPKNTARWRIRIPQSLWTGNNFVRPDGTRFNPTDDVVLTVRTRLWDDTLADPLATGTVYPTPIQPDNLSETYTWWADSSIDVPFTERSQFQGDPRHNPYKDLWNGQEFANGYNWFFDALNNDLEDARVDFPGIDPARLRNRWNGSLRQDVPRFMEILRTGLVNCNAIFTTLTGYSYYYLGFGGDIGYDSANNYPNSIPTNLRPFGAPGSNGFINTITGSNRLVVGQSVAGVYWWGFPWLGELYEDAAFTTQWLADDGAGHPRGNLDAGIGGSQYWRRLEYDTYWFSGTTAYGTRLYPSIQRTNTRGCTTFFNIGTAASTFSHLFAGGQTGTLVESGPELAANYNFPMPTTTMISRPFRINQNVGTFDHWDFAPYSTNRFLGAQIRRYYDHQSGATGSAIIELRDPADTNSAYVVVNGIDRTVETGSAFISKFALLSMVQTFFEAGNPALAHRIKMPPRVTIAAPNEVTELIDPLSIAIQWDVEWLRWDGMKYTVATASTFSEPENELEYVALYSRDGGATWLHVEDDTPIAEIGVKPTNPLYLHADTAAGPESLAMGTPPASFPKGSYLLRVECYRMNQALHYSSHQVKIYIER
jgi:hypothetical protein